MKPVQRRVAPASYRFPGQFPAGDPAGRPTHCRDRRQLDRADDDCQACGAAAGQPCRRA